MFPWVVRVGEREFSAGHRWVGRDQENPRFLCPESFRFQWGTTLKQPTEWMMISLRLDSDGGGPSHLSKVSPAFVGPESRATQGSSTGRSPGSLQAFQIQQEC